MTSDGKTFSDFPENQLIKTRPTVRNTQHAQ